jgi:hypothetical protein
VGLAFRLRSAAPVTLEFQREKAKELTKFFKQQQFNALINDSRCASNRAARTASWPPKRNAARSLSRTNTTGAALCMCTAASHALRSAACSGALPLQRVRLDEEQRDLQRALGDVWPVCGHGDRVRNRRRLPQPAEAHCLSAGHRGA